jgi:hypothetical protein
MRILEIIKETGNYIFLKKQVKKYKNTENWNKYRLRYNWFYTIYTVVNIPNEVYDAEPSFHRMWVVEAAKPINDFMAEMNLHEIVEFKIKQYDERNYFLIYKPYFNSFSFWWFMKYVLLIAGVFYLHSKIDLLIIYKVVLDKLHLFYELLKMHI